MLLIFFVSLAILSGCNKSDKTADKTSTEKKTEGNTQTNSENAGKTNNSDNVKSALFTVKNVEEVSGKNMSPNVTWNENGKDVSIKDLKGNVVMVNLWATWCGPCKKELPDLSKLSTDLKGKNFRMLGVNVFQQPSAQSIEDFLKSTPLPYTILDGNDKLVEQFAKASGSPIDGVPTTFIIDKDGKIVESLVGARSSDEYMKYLNKYLN